MSRAEKNPFFLWNIAEECYIIRDYVLLRIYGSDGGGRLKYCPFSAPPLNCRKASERFYNAQTAKTVTFVKKWVTKQI